MSAVAGAVGGAAVVAVNAASSSSVVSSNLNSGYLMDAERVFYMRIGYHTQPSDNDGYNGELLIEVDDGEMDGFFGKKKLTKLVPLPEGVIKKLPEGAKILNVVIDWHAERVRVYYTL